jgi:lysophospholipase L1-like esterase
MNLGLAGQCFLDTFMARAIRDLPADAISLELGINVVNADAMRDRTFTSAVHGFLDTVRDGHPTTPILVVTPISVRSPKTGLARPLSAQTPATTPVDRPALLAVGALSLARVRGLLQHAVDVRRAEGDDNLRIADGLHLFGDNDVADLPDGLHPNAAGYRRIAERFLPITFGPQGALKSAGTQA